MDGKRLNLKLVGIIIISLMIDGIELNPGPKSNGGPVQHSPKESLFNRDFVSNKPASKIKRCEEEAHEDQEISMGVFKTLIINHGQKQENYCKVCMTQMNENMKQLENNLVCIENHIMPKIIKLEETSNALMSEIKILKSDLDQTKEINRNTLHTVNYLEDQLLKCNLIIHNLDQENDLLGAVSGYLKDTMNFELSCEMLADLYVLPFGGKFKAILISMTSYKFKETIWKCFLDYKKVNKERKLEMYITQHYSHSNMIVRKKLAPFLNKAIATCRPLTPVPEPQTQHNMGLEPHSPGNQLRVYWGDNTEKLIKYQTYLNTNLVTADPYDSIELIRNAALYARYIKQPKQSVSSPCAAWFDGECRVLRSQLCRHLKHEKRGQLPFEDYHTFYKDNKTTCFLTLSSFLPLSCRLSVLSGCQ
ncbi:hypothetical protein CHUAL_004409 [Chamberlinius hualienensis]